MAINLLEKKDIPERFQKCKQWSSIEKLLEGKRDESIKRFPKKGDIVRKNGDPQVVLDIDVNDSECQIRRIDDDSPEFRDTIHWASVRYCKIIMEEAEWKTIEKYILHFIKEKKESLERDWTAGTTVKLIRSHKFDWQPIPFLPPIKVKIPEGETGVLLEMCSCGKAVVSFAGKSIQEIPREKLESCVPDRTAWDQVILPEDIKRKIEAIGRYNYKTLKKYDLGFAGEDDYGMMPHAILFGPPGVGKTKLMEALQKILSRFVVKINGTNVRNDIEAVKQAMSDAVKYKGILFVDEFSHLGPDTKALLIQALESVDIPVIIATNETEMHPALADRISNKIKVDYPTKEAYREIWKVLLGNESHRVDLDRLAVHTPQETSGRDIKSAIMTVLAMAGLSDGSKEGHAAKMIGDVFPFTEDALIEHLEEIKAVKEEMVEFKPWNSPNHM